MIIIRSFDAGVFLEKESFALYDSQYPADEHGNEIDESDPRYKTGYFNECGDIIFETSSVKYIFKKVINSFLWIKEILDYINNHINDTNIIVDMNCLYKESDGGYREFNGVFSVEYK